MDEIEFRNLTHKVKTYQQVIQNTVEYREIWKDSLKDKIIEDLELMIKASGLNAKVITKSQIENLEAVVVTLGEQRSGLFHKVNEDIQRHMIKHNGSLIYQQLFNGKIMVLINYPTIEDYGQPRPPKTVAIYRPEELKEPYLIRHMEQFVTEITQAEDFDDDEPNQKIGFALNLQDQADDFED